MVGQPQRNCPIHYGITQSSSYWGEAVVPVPLPLVLLGVEVLLLLGVEVLLLPDVEVLLLLTLAASSAESWRRPVQPGKHRLDGPTTL